MSDNAVDKEVRQAAESINFGLIYAMGPTTLARTARDSYGVNMAVEEATLFRDRFFKAYKGIADWHRLIRSCSQKETRTLSGRRRLMEDNPRVTTLYNTPVQGTSADIMKKALVLVNNCIDQESIKLVATIHDEIILEVAEERAEEATTMLKQRMIEAGEFYLKDIPIEVEITIADSWASK
jgi:DNA polymerase I-like protein with 3'-5' exonuclease and polymerase domains